MSTPELVLAAFDPCTAKFWVTVGGAVCELVGLALVVLDVRDARRAAQRVTPTTRPAYLSGVLSGKPGLQADASGGHKPPLDERMELLETAVRQLDQEQRERVSELRKEMYVHVGRVQTAALEHADTRDWALREFIASQLTSGVGRSLVGAGLFAVGVIASAVSNLM